MGYRIVHELTAGQIDELVALYANEFWCKQRTPGDVRRMLEATDVVIGVVEHGGGDDSHAPLVAFGRVLTAFVYRATVYDVIVRPDRRGRGLARRVMDGIFSHPRLAGVESFDLTCRPEMSAMYAKWGFSPLSETICLRRRR